MLSASEAADHPHVDTTDLKPETCLKCHPSKNQGKFVHSAVGMGCEVCHQVVSGDSQSTITLRASDGNLCAKCHETTKDPILHAPYRQGRCLICHNPHSGPYMAETRAAAATLCLSCHMTNYPGIGVNAQAGTVSLLDGESYDMASWQRAPKIDETHSQGAMENLRPLLQAPEKHATELNCLSCHNPHASRSKHLLRDVVEGKGVSRNSFQGAHAGLESQRNQSMDAPALNGTSIRGQQ